jgi:hypothetical protein
MKQIITLKIYAQDTEILYKRFAKNILWRFYLGVDSHSTMFLDERIAIILSIIKRAKSIIDKENYQEKLATFDPGKPKERIIRVGHPNQINVLIYFEIYDKALFLLEFIWINALLSTDRYTGLKRKMHNTFVDTCSKLLAMTKK